jgi:spoIIIJ-associated protein
MNKADVIKNEAVDLLSKIIDKPDVEVIEEGESFMIVIKTEEDAPIVIGRHGETIKAIQKLLEVILYKKLGESVEVLVNVNDYREKQKERIQEITDRYASQAKESGEQTFIKGFSSYERKLAHEYITESYPDLTTFSEGEGRDRKLIIEVKEKE